MTRSALLERKLERYLHTRAWTALLSEMPGLELVAMDVTDVDFSIAAARSRETWFIAAVPDAVLRDTYDERSSPAVVTAWMFRVLVESMMAETIGKDQFYLHTEAYHAAGWTAFRSEDILREIPALYHRLTHKIITIASADLQRTLVFRTTEHFWHAYWTWPVTMQEN
jgi:hypothetical protein